MHYLLPVSIIIPILTHYLQLIGKREFLLTNVDKT